jgi:hypothetical protein
MPNAKVSTRVLAGRQAGVTASQDQTARVFIVDLVDLVIWAEHQLSIETK